MKLSKIAKLAKSYGRLEVYRVNRFDVWLGVGAAIYKCAGLPLIYGERNAMAVLGLTREEFEKISFTEKDLDVQRDDGSFFHDTDKTETGTQELILQAAFANGFFNVLQRYNGELVFFDPGLLAPLKGKDSRYTQLCVRQGDGGAYIAVKNGFFLEAIIKPMKVDLNNYVDRLSAFLDKITAHLAREAEREAEAAEEEPEQPMIGG